MNLEKSYSTVSYSKNLGTLYTIDTIIEKNMKYLAFLILFSGLIIATNLSIVTVKVAKTDPTRPMCTNPNLR